jgi:UDP-N-acetylglucosamine acyltransferase
MAIHPSAVVEHGARIDPAADVGPFCIVGAGATLGPGSRLLHSVTVSGRTTIGARNVFHPYCVIGGDPQDLKFRGEDSVLVIGDDNVFREGATVNKGTLMGGNRTAIGNRNLVMATAHVAHDSIVEDDCILANASLLAGHVKVESHATISGWVAIHHFVTVGRHAVVSGCSRISQDVPPFMIVQGVQAEVRGVNSVGLRRRGFKPDVINALRKAHRVLWRSGLPKPEALVELERQDGIGPEVRTLIEFLRASDRGRMGRALESLRAAPVVPDPESELLE